MPFHRAVYIRKTMRFHMYQSISTRCLLVEDEILVVDWAPNLLDCNLLANLWALLMQAEGFTLE